jgi:cold shock CspA family protein
MRQTGYIKTVRLNAGFCFIAVLNGPDAYCKLDELEPSIDLDETLLNRRVSFETYQGHQGAVAVAVQAL